MHRTFATALIVLLAALVCPRPAFAQERAYFVTYDHYLEEPRNMEIAVANTTGVPKSDAPAYSAPWLELEYGVTGWWTSELYLEGVAVHGDSSAFGGWRIENRFRPLRSEHRINPVLYVEYENLNEASRIQKEIVGAGALANEPIADLRRAHARELEGKLILSSVIAGWNLAENFVVEKNLSEDEASSLVTASARRAPSRHWRAVAIVDYAERTSLRALSCTVASDPQRSAAWPKRDISWLQSSPGMRRRDPR